MIGTLLRSLLLVLALAWPAVGSCASHYLSVISFNVESDRDTDPRKIAGDIALIGKGADLFGLAEVASEEDAETYRQAAEKAGAQFGKVFARHGDQDRLAILYNETTLTLQGVRELERFPGSRKALVGRFVHNASEIEFLFIVNHFNRRDEQRRLRQAELIRDWVLEQPLPAVLTGDHNFDFDPRAMRGNRSFEVFTARPELRWIQPECLTAGDCPPNGTQCDQRFNSIMDMVLVADKGRGWAAVSDVLMKQADYCVRERKGWADHRPVGAVIAIQ